MNRKILLIVMASLFLAACAPKVTQANFDKIHVGMTQQQVQAILGAPSHSSGMAIGSLSGTSESWHTKGATITIQFLNGKVQFRRFTQQRPDDD